MVNEKNLDLEDAAGSEESEFVGDSSSRARNRTVMLTPEITGEVRARLARDMQGAPSGDPEEPEPLTGGGFSTPGSSYTPASEFSRPGGNDSGFAPVRPAPPEAQVPPVLSGGGGPDPFSQPAPPQPSVSSPAPTLHAGSIDEGVIWTKESPVVGFLVSYDKNPNGKVFELRSGRMIVTSEASAGGNFLVVNDSSVSPMHAIMRISQDGDIQILDQLSEFGTRILRFESGDEQELSGDKSHLNHGDVVVFGERTFCVCLVVRPEELEEE